MKPEPLLAAFGKVEWAITQIDQLNGQIKAFFDKNPHRLVPNIEVEVPRLEPIKIWRLNIDPIPTSIYSQVGVVLGLLREPLDQIIAASCKLRGKSEGGIFFIFGETRDDFKTALDEAKKIPRDIRDLIAETEPFFGGGGHLLAALHYLKNPDKHRSPLVPIMLDTVINMADVRAYDGPVFTIGPRRGLHMRRNPITNNMEQPDTKRAPKFVQNMNGQPRIAFRADSNGSPKDRMEVATTAIVTKLQMQFEPALGVTFAEVSRVYGEPITSVLTQMRDLVEGILLVFERRFFT